MADISHEGLRQLLREEEVRFQAVRSWKRSTDRYFERKRDRILELYDLAERAAAVVICLDEFGPPQLPAPARRPRLGRPEPNRDASAPASSARTACATCCRPTTSHATGSTATSKSARAGPSSWSSAATYARSTQPRSACTSCSTTSQPHKGQQVRDWAHDNNVELAYTRRLRLLAKPHRAQFRALRYFTLAAPTTPTTPPRQA